MKYPHSCRDCGVALHSATATEKALMDGCPNCGSTDIDVNPNHPARVARDFSLEHACREYQTRINR